MPDIGDPVAGPATPPGLPQGPDRRADVLRDRVPLAWLALAVLLTGLHRWVPAATWLMIHLVLLGALTHAAMVWSEHFSLALLRGRRGEHDRRDQRRRLALLTVGATGVFMGVPAGLPWVTVAGATLVGAAVTAHVWRLRTLLRASLPTRFRALVRYYLAAAACLLLGAALGASAGWDLTRPYLTPQAHDRLVVAHLTVNLLGWLGLTVTGTLVTLWPTVLRTRMDARAGRLAGQALPVFLTGIALVAASAVGGLAWGGVVGLIVYLAGLLWWARALVTPAMTKPPTEYAGAAIGAALVWYGAGVVGLGRLLVGTTAWSRDDLGPVAAVFVVGFGAQLLTGALSYLMPTVIGGGPHVVRAFQAWLNRWATARLTVFNVAAFLWLLPLPSWVRVGLSGLAVASLTLFLPLLLLGVRAAAATRAALGRGEPAPGGPPWRAPWSARQFLGGLASVAVVIALGIAVDPSVLPGRGGAAREVAASGRTVRVEVSAKDMTFTPRQVSVGRGDRLIVTLINTDPSTTHDLRLGDVSTPRLRTGARAELDVGLVGESMQGWCTVAGHRQMGMVFDVFVPDGPGQVAATGGTPGASGVPSAMTHDPAGHASAHPGTWAAPPSGLVDPRLPAAPAGRTHRVTLRVQEVPIEVAPGVWQQRWTYNGGSVGPTLHGKVGDTFEVTLVNEGTMGHSIDFHAGALAPDRPMRTIPPGESLLYTFTATRAGAWLYHCSTMPMSAHIAAGMHGAVVIDPPGLGPVAASYVLVQSELYLAGTATSAADAREVDAAKAAAQTPDHVVFNGIANQYDAAPLTARVGQPVRIWLVDAGPARPVSFHVVGGQFDTTYAEGAHLLRAGRDALGGTSGGSQALALQPGQGGFVEITFPEAGHYPFVTHVMGDAESGAHGIVVVS